jgi:hypothetical protein
MAASKEQDEKSKRLRELLSSFYGSGSPESESRLGRRDTLQGINLPNFDSDHYIASLVSSRSSRFLLVSAAT